MDIILTDEQAGAIKAIKQWFSYVSRGAKNTFVLGGFAGTGKTTIVKFIVDDLGLEMGDIRFVAYTGKASMVLRKKGLPATTIHSLIYQPRSSAGVVSFVKRPFMELEDIELIICDESSMVGSTIKEDLESYGIPVLYIGDHFQLPPVSKDQINLMANPDYRLETIHRQALDNPIIRIAHAIRMGENVGYGSYGDTCFVIPSNKVKEEYMLAADQVICGFNNSRHSLNYRIRKLRGLRSDTPEPTDKLVCLKNNNELGLVNGMLGTCHSYSKGFSTLSFLNDEGVRYDGLYVDKDAFFGTQITWKRGVEQFDFGYALTCHKFQGSEAPKILVFEEIFGDDDEMRRRWKYTAYTRASEKLIVVK